MTIIQFPNKYLITMFLAWLVTMITTGIILSFSRAIFYSAGIIWAYEEIIHGVNWFRKTLGAVVMVLLILGLTKSLRS